MGNEKKLPSRTKADSQGVADFLSKVAAIPNRASTGRRGRLIFALDATVSRQPTWDQACHIQAEMFQETEALGGLDVQLVYYRGFRECKPASGMASRRRCCVP